MNITTETDARSLAAITRIERERAEWLATFAHHAVPGSACYIAAMKSYDEAASAALTQSLADAVCSEYQEVC